MLATVRAWAAMITAATHTAVEVVAVAIRVDSTIVAFDFAWTLASGSVQWNC
jgi:hypothetical protein